MGWTVVGLAFVAGASGAAFNHFYTGEIDKESRQKYTAIVTFGYAVVPSHPLHAAMLKHSCSQRRTFLTMFAALQGCSDSAGTAHNMDIVAHYSGKQRQSKKKAITVGCYRHHSTSSLLV